MKLGAEWHGRTKLIGLFKRPRNAIDGGGGARPLARAAPR
jgi:hypothetical protein